MMKAVPFCHAEQQAPNHSIDRLSRTMLVRGAEIMRFERTTAMTSALCFGISSHTNTSLPAILQKLCSKNFATLAGISFSLFLSLLERANHVDAKTL